MARPAQTRTKKKERKNISSGVALGVGLEVAQVADVALLVRGRAVGLAERVD